MAFLNEQGIFEIFEKKHGQLKETRIQREHIGGKKPKEREILKLDFVRLSLFGEVTLDELNFIHNN